jgi:Arc/MetJ family transcription regulator
VKRTNLVLDEELLEKVKAELGLKTYSEVVNAYASRGVWQGDQGDLSQMREDERVSG